MLKPDSHHETHIFIAVDPIKNKTTYPELDWRVTDAIVMALTDWPWIKVVPYDKADYVLSGDILSYRSQIPYTYDSQKNPLEYKLNIEIVLFFRTLKAKNEQQSPAPNEKGHNKDFDLAFREIPRLQEEEIYRIGKNISGYKQAEWEALERAIRRLTGRAMDQLIGMNLLCY